MSRGDGPELEVTLPQKVWEDVLFCLGPDGVGWGEYSVEESREENLLRALAEIQSRVDASPFYKPETPS